MDLFGIAPLEVVVVLLVALLVMGPARMVQVAQSIGKFWREAQRSLREMADAATVKLDGEPLDEEPQALAEPSDSVSRSTAADGALNGGSRRQGRSRRVSGPEREGRRRG